MQPLVEHVRTFTERVAANAKKTERIARGRTTKTPPVSCHGARPGTINVHRPESGPSSGRL